MSGDSDSDAGEIEEGVTYIPQVRNEERPYVGMEFDSLDLVHEFYNLYGLMGGFGIRKEKEEKDRNGMIIRKEFVCSKQGIFKKDGLVRKRKRGYIRCDCKAKVVVVKTFSRKKYTMSVFIEGHNHKLLEGNRVHLLRSHRHISIAKKLLTQQLGAVNISTHKKISILEVQSGGMEKIGCTKKDIYNFEYLVSENMRNHDVELVTEYFVAKKKMNESFYFKIEGDANDRFTRCFWADAASRRAYGFYGDVIVMDTTFNTNRYGLPFAPILGVNNHGQTIVLACAFLSNETTESFIWMFEEFRKAMPGDAPKMIITDQDAAIGRAIKEVLPSTFHRLCIWHILTKFSDINKLPLDAYERYWGDFVKKEIWEIDSKEEFDAKWKDLQTKSGLIDNLWLNSLFDLKESWVPAYVKHVFAAGMSSSQRAEGSHAFFKQYITKKNSLLDFLTRFERALSHQRQNELLADHIDAYEKPQCTLPAAMDKQMAGLYTKGIFQKFEHELLQSLVCFLELKTSDAYKVVYKVSERYKGRTRVKEVVYDKTSDWVSCSCKRFEFAGIICRHALAFLRMEQVEYLPNKYILNRWKKSAKLGVVEDLEGKQIEDCVDSCLLLKRGTMSRLASYVVEDSLMSKDGYDMVLETLNGLLVNLKTINGSGPTPVGDGGSKSQTKYLKDPKRVKCKGNAKRVKGGKEKGIERGVRHCGECGRTDHDIRRCPRMLNTPASPTENESSPINLSDPLFDEFDMMHGPSRS